jgi:tetratricopeptide (TPR) repeat protein
MAAAHIKACNTCGVESDDYLLHKHGCKYNPESCEICGKTDGLRSCAGCMHRKYCCTEHQKEAWKDHKTICNVYKKLELSTNTDPEDTAWMLLSHSQELTFGSEVRLELALRVSIEALAMAKHFGLKELHLKGLAQVSMSLLMSEKIEEAEIFARDAVDYARDELRDVEKETEAAGALAIVLVKASKPQETIELCDHHLVLNGTDDAEMNGLRLHKSKALSAMNRHEEAVAQLSFVHTSKYAQSSDWQVLSRAHEKAGQLSEAIKSMEKAVELARWIHTSARS